MRPNGLFRVVPEMLSEQARLEPHAWFQEMRQTAPIRYDAEREAWDIFRYEDVLEIYQHPQVFSSVERPNMEGVKGPSILTMDPPRHTKLRGLVSRAFTPSAIAKWEPTVRTVGHTLLDDLQGRGEIDLVMDFAYPLPIIVISEMIGVPKEDRLLFRDWIQTIFQGLADDVTGEDIAAIIAKKMQAHQDLTAYFLNLFAERRKQPQDDLVTMLLQAEVDGERLIDPELVEFCFLLMLGGFETTTNFICNGVRIFLDEPDTFARLRREPALLGTAMEEILRYRSPVMTGLRCVYQDVTFRGHQLKAEDQLVIWVGSANRDEAVFATADRFVIDRTPNPHLAFGNGIHYCLGSNLARLEGRFAFTAILERLGELQYVDKALLKPLPSTVTYGVSYFPVRIGG